MSWYRAGTIAVSGTTVTGTGTNWTDNKMGIGPGQAFLIPGAGTVKMYEILRVDSATKLTLTSDAATVAAGQAYAIMSFYSDSIPDFARRLSAQLSYYQSQMDGWQQIMTGTGSITLQAPDGTEVTISSFKKLTDDMANKADKVSGAVPITQGGTGAVTAADARTKLGLGNAATLSVGTGANTVAAGNDSRLNTIDGKSGGTLSTTQLYTGPNAAAPNNRAGLQSLGVSTVGAVVSRASFAYYNDSGYIGVTRGGSSLIQDLRLGIDKANGTWVTWNLDYSGNATAANGSWVNSSDGRIKTNKKRIENPLVKMRLMYGYTWDRLDEAPSGQGFIAQEVQKVMPTGVFEGNETILKDGTIIEKTLSVDVIGVAAALHHEAILALMDKVEKLESAIGEMNGSRENLHNA